MLSKAAAAILLSALFCAMGSAQVVYEPVTSQYRIGDRCFYYGGSDPRVIAATERKLADEDRGYRRERAYGVGYLHRGLIGEPPQYTVLDSRLLQNAIVYGYTSVDAHNDANSSVPRYFRMADLRASAVPAADGMGVVIAAQALGTIDILPTHRAAAGPSTAPATQPKPLMIIPRKAFEQYLERLRIVYAAH